MLPRRHHHEYRGRRIHRFCEDQIGSVALVYNGSGRYVERNDADRRVVIEARGKDKRGNGTATAIITASFAESGEQTDVEVLTDLAITGKPAQFGRGVISDVSDKLLEQFLACVPGRFPEGLGATDEAHDERSIAADADTGFDEADTEQTIQLETVPAAASSGEGVGSPGADIAPPATVTPLQTAPPTSEASRSASPSGETGHSTLNCIQHRCTGCVEALRPALAIVGLLLFVVIKIIRRKS